MCHSLTYNQNDSFALFSRQILKLLSKCCVFKVRQYKILIFFRKTMPMFQTVANLPSYVLEEEEEEEEE